jgi:hypothetical protein
MSKIVTRLYDTYSEAVSVINALEAAEISHNDISIVANNVDDKNDPTHKDATGKGAGAGAAGLGAVGAGAGVLAGLGLMAIPGVGPVVAAGWLVSALAGAAVGAGAGAAAGGLLGKLREYEVSKEDSDLYLEAIRRGAALVSVKADDEDRAKVEAIMDEHQGINMTARGQAYRASEWRAFDANAPVYTPDQVEAERARYR